jgi:hypothetical protein
MLITIQQSMNQRNLLNGGCQTLTRYAGECPCKSSDIVEELNNPLDTRFLHSELGWKQDKVDDLLLPVIHKVGKARHLPIHSHPHVPGGALDPYRRRDCVAQTSDVLIFGH